MHTRFGLTALLLAARAFDATAATPTPGPLPVSVRFEARVGERPFACGEQYAGIGRTASTISVTDFRFYVSNLRLLTAAGAEVPVALEQDGLWQHEDVALLDFEDGSGRCADGTAEVRDVVTGTIAPGDYVGVRFDLGVPFGLNHREVTVAPSPLNLTRMFWSWNGGYKFARIELRSRGQPQGWMVHLGSTGCAPADGPSTVPLTCRNPNRAAVHLAPFAAGSDIVQFDLAAMLAGADVDANQDNTPRGCMSGPEDRDCTAVLDALGLSGGNSTQRVFRVRTPATVAADLSQ